MKLLLFKLIFVISIFNFTALKSETVNTVIIDGNKRVSEETIILYGDIKLNEEINENKLNLILKNLYSTEFFEDVKLRVDKGTLFVNLKEYPIINQLILVGEPSNRIKNDILKNLKLKQKNSFIKSYLSNDIETIKRLYSSIGYNNSVIETKAKKIDENNFDLVISIDRGNITAISSISFIGDKKIRDKRLRDIIASEEDKFYKFISRNTKFIKNLINLDIRLLNNYYRSLGYYDVKITSNSAQLNEKGNIDLIYTIDAGTRYRINKIITNADPVFDKKIFFSLNKEYKKYIGDYILHLKLKNYLKK